MSPHHSRRAGTGDAPTLAATLPTCGKQAPQFHFSHFQGVECLFWLVGIAHLKSLSEPLVRFHQCSLQTPTPAHLSSRRTTSSIPTCWLFFTPLPFPLPPPFVFHSETAPKHPADACRDGFSRGGCICPAFPNYAPRCSRHRLRPAQYCPPGHRPRSSLSPFCPPDGGVEDGGPVGFNAGGSRGGRRCCRC